MSRSQMIDRTPTQRSQQNNQRFRAYQPLISLEEELEAPSHRSIDSNGNSLQSLSDQFAQNSDYHQKK